ncbi:MAG TPA: hypothetical protein PKN80_03545 [bacterium]|nr:hypothetical protein [bacterium]HNS49321.1 hypothetical protein [bacterium]
MKRSAAGLTFFFALLALGNAAFGQAAGAGKNILWDGGFEIGYGNNFWGAPNGNYGPNRRDMWSNGVIKLNSRIASRIYWLEEGTYTLGAWVKRGPEAADPNQNFALRLLLTNLNYYDDKQRNEYGKVFPVAAGEGWQRVGWSIEIQGPVRNYFHVEIGPAENVGPGILLDGVSLTRGTELPEKLPAAAAVEAGFWIPEETGIYVDGEERVVELVIRNNGAARPARVRWEVYDWQNKLVKQDALNENLPAAATLRRKLPLADLPWGGYRLACSVEGEPVLGDALLTLVPRIDQEAFPQYGGDAAVNLASKDFTGRFLKRIGMKVANTLSPGGGVGRWTGVNPAEGEYNWQQEPAVDAVRKQGGVEVVGFLGLKYPPAWVVAKYMKDGQVVDEAGFIKAYADYVYAFVKHYAGRITRITLEDEIGGSYGGPVKDSLLMRVYAAAYAAAKRAAREAGTTISVGINSTRPAWWSDFLDLVDRKQLDYVSQNTLLRPGWSAETLNIMRQKGAYPEYFYTVGVGQRSQLRGTSLILDGASSSGNPPGIFAWQLMMHAWLSRPYGTEDPKDGPLVSAGFYDLRTLGQSVYLPLGGKTGIEYDNSPTLGMQWMAMQKYWLSGMRPARDPKQAYSLNGEPTGHERLFVYPFRNREKTVVVLTTVNGTDNNSQDFDCHWKLSGLDFNRYRPADIYGQPLKPAADGTLLVPQLPVLFTGLAAADLPAALANFKEMKAEPAASTGARQLAVGKYTLEINPDRPGYLRLMVKEGGRERTLIDGLVGQPELPKPAVEVADGRLEAKATLAFDSKRYLSLTVSEQGVTMRWRQDNTERAEVKQVLRFRIPNEGAGREIVIQEGPKVIAGLLREDYGQLTPAAALPAPAALHPDASTVSLKGFGDYYLSGATGQGGFTPKTGFRWRTSDGQALLEANYTISAYPGGGTRGIQRIIMDLQISAP